MFPHVPSSETATIEAAAIGVVLTRYSINRPVNTIVRNYNKYVVTEL